MPDERPEITVPETKIYTYTLREAREKAAYSEKKIKNREKSTYREKIKRELAGAKGVGRFSCDRLGENLRLVTKSADEEKAHVVDINWNSFELNDKKEFVKIPVDYSQIDKLPSGFSNGTTLIIDNFREPWYRSDLLKLKRSLMKLINPDADKGDIPFNIQMDVPSEKENDQKTLEKKGTNKDRDIVNGIINNDIFEKLNIKTTNINVNISDDGQFITSKLFDRGEYIFTVVEKNRNYRLLKNIYISVFYLNRSAKLNFTRQMGGVTPKDYGSIFIYKNGFRINPYGEPGQDFLGIDQRKAQGWKRFLGTREMMGHISIKGNNEQFIETTSRAHGFIQNESVDMLHELFIEKVLKVLEKYVVNLINWGEPLRYDPSHTISPDEIGNKIVNQLISATNNRDIIKVDYNSKMFDNSLSLASKDNITTSLRKLENVAEHTKNTAIIDLAKTVKKRTESILSHNVQLAEEVQATNKNLLLVKQEGHIREKQIYFLKGATNQNVANLLSGLHSIYTLTDAIKGNSCYLRDMIVKNKTNDKKSILSIISEIYQSNDKAHKISDLAIHGNQKLKQSGKNNIHEFIRQYIKAGFFLKGLKYVIMADSKPYDCVFDPSSMGIIIDNVSSNSFKAHASQLDINLEETTEYIQINFIDNGMGLAEGIDPNSLFEWGVSSNITNKGFGIGLYHIKQLVDEMHGKVYIDTSYKNGFKLVVCLKK